MEMRPLIDARGEDCRLPRTAKPATGSAFSLFLKDAASGADPRAEGAGSSEENRPAPAEASKPGGKPKRAEKAAGAQPTAVAGGPAADADRPPAEMAGTDTPARPESAGAAVHSDGEVRASLQAPHALDAASMAAAALLADDAVADGAGAQETGILAAGAQATRSEGGEAPIAGAPVPPDQAMPVDTQGEIEKQPPADGGSKSASPAHASGMAAPVGETAALPEEAAGGEAGSSGDGGGEDGEAAAEPAREPAEPAHLREANPRAAAVSESPQSPASSGADASPAAGETMAGADIAAPLQAAAPASGKALVAAGGRAELLEPARLPELALRILGDMRRDETQGYRTRLRLHPPELGRVDIELRMAGDRVWARFTVHEAAAREPILEQMHRLREALADQGFTQAELDVQVGTGATGRQAEEQEEDASASLGRRATADVQAVSPRGAAQTAAGHIDLRV
jgi:flagellar hook-length control protein FliK